MIVPDLNLLLYAQFRDVPQHQLALHWWQDAMEGREQVGIPWLVVSGFVRVATHASAMTLPLSTSQAMGVVADWLSMPHVNPLNPGSRHLSIMENLLGAAGVGGNLVNDAHIAALAIEFQAEVHSNDSDFARFPGLRWRNPLQDPR